MFNRAAPRSRRVALVLVIAAGLACVRPPRPFVPAGPPTRLAIVAPRDDSNYEVDVQDAAQRLHRCRAPCQLQVASGTANFSIRGDRNQDLSHVLHPGATQVQLRERSELSFVMGWVTLGLGALLTVGSAAAYVDAPRSSQDVLMGTLGLGAATAALGSLLTLLAGTNAPEFRNFDTGVR